MKKACVLLIVLHLAVAAAAERRLVAVTFDDLPVAGGSMKTEAEKRAITLRLLSALADRDIPATGFVNEVALEVDGAVSDSRVDLLRLWLAAGQDLGNHTYSHPDLHRVAVDDFIRDADRGDTIIGPLLGERGRRPHYFRHPYLHTGRSLEDRRMVDDFLTASGYRVAPVSIDNSEWIFARAYDLVLASGDHALAAEIGADYVDYMMRMVGYIERQAQGIFSRNIAHVMLLHANELNSAWFGALADRLAALGYRFVSLDEALLDPAYESQDTYIGPGGITWLHRWAHALRIDPDDFGAEPDTPDYVLQIAQQREHRYESE